jgi:hypothetical protein
MIWLVLAWLLPAIILIAVILRQTGPVEVPQIQLSAPK